jgi:hypothetical protein
MSFFQKNKKEEVKEPFCAPCVAGIAALAGSGVAGGSTKVEDKKTKDTIFWIGVGVTIISIIILIYLLCFKKCKTCR